MASIPADQFDPEPRTANEYLRDIWRRVGSLEAKVTIQNGRVSRLERFMWAAGGGLAVVTAVAVPIFLDLVNR